MTHFKYLEIRKSAYGSYQIWQTILRCVFHDPSFLVFMLLSIDWPTGLLLTKVYGKVNGMSLP